MKAFNRHYAFFEDDPVHPQHEDYCGTHPTGIHVHSCHACKLMIARRYRDLGSIEAVPSGAWPIHAEVTRTIVVLHYRHFIVSLQDHASSYASQTTAIR